MAPVTNQVTKSERSNPIKIRDLKEALNGLPDDLDIVANGWEIEELEIWRDVSGEAFSLNMRHESFL